MDIKLEWNKSGSLVLKCDGHEDREIGRALLGDTEQQYREFVARRLGDLVMDRMNIPRCPYTGIFDR